MKPNPFSALNHFTMPLAIPQSCGVAEAMSVTSTLHPLIAEVAAERHISGFYRDAVSRAFHEVEHRVQTLVGVSDVGERLMGIAFGSSGLGDRSSGGDAKGVPSRVIYKSPSRGSRSQRGSGRHACAQRSECRRFHRVRLPDRRDGGKEHEPMSPLEGCGPSSRREEHLVIRRRTETQSADLTSGEPRSRK
ncbi:TIGR02391 family protein [Streptomyces sp. NPDC093675]|uniref:TIGR02391 family protein n=1 Tax=Streptomyces sp. NPDC093675 TaxID=3366049 RepID=UPI0038204F24